MRESRSNAAIGGLCALAAYGLWGLSPVYFKLLANISALEVLAHRVIWSVFFLAILVCWQGRWTSVRDVWRNPRLVALLALTMMLVGINWFIFVWGVLNQQMIQTSLGYYINPFANTLLGLIVLRERLSRWQIMALALAAAGVVNEIWQLGKLPWVSLLVATSFAGYALLRKRAPVEALPGLLVETLCAAPIAIAYLFWLKYNGTLAWLHRSSEIDVLLFATGIVTAVPMLFFGLAAKRLSLTTLGFFQYLSPSMALLQAVFWFNEPFPASRVVTFAFIWSGLLLFSWGNFVALKERRR